MKNMRGKILRKLKSISNPTWKPGLVFQTNTQIQTFQTSNLAEKNKNLGFSTLTDESLSTSKTPLDIKEVKMAPGHNADIDEFFLPSTRPKAPDETETVSTHDLLKSTVDLDPPSLEISTSAFRPPIAEIEIPSEDKDQEKLITLISGFEDRCPPGGKDILVLYTTSLRGIRKTFEDCNTIRFLLESFRVLYSERDVSMHLEYRNELWEILGGQVVPPRLFIRGRYIGGADEVVGLHETGMFQNLLRGIPLSPSNCPCRGCGGMRFVLCLSCNGSRKVVVSEGENSGVSIRCSDCNENGLIKCSFCG